MRKDPRDLVDALLEYAVKFAERNGEPETGACWDVIEEARAYLRKTASAGVAAKRDCVMGRADESQAGGEEGGSEAREPDASARHQPPQHRVAQVGGPGPHGTARAQSARAT